jgi:hypothetical protein
MLARNQLAGDVNIVEYVIRYNLNIGAHRIR